jgi:23S rRNA (uracil1939-C5)-methyltransferase
VRVEFTIEKWVYGGEGLARIEADDQGRRKAVFVPFVLPGETVEATVIEDRAGFARARFDSIEKPALARVPPMCQYFFRCGGCQYQHADYGKQLELKRDILVETLQRVAKIQLAIEVQLHSAEPYQYRNRTRLKVRSGPEFAIGYHRFGTNELLPVKECPISSPLIQRGIAAMWEIGQESDCEGLREVQFFATHDDSKLLVEFYSEHDTAGTLDGFVGKLRRALPEIAGVTVFPWSTSDADDERAPLTTIRDGSSAQTFGDRSLEYKTEAGTFRVSAGSFFQTNRFLVDELVRTAVADVSGHTALDLYAGTGLFSVPLAKRFDRVIAVESSPFSSADLRHNMPPNAKPVQATTEQYLQNVGQKSGLDFVLLDPPRSGMGERTARMLGQLRVPRLTYVSCDPATLARDVRVLEQYGFRIESAHLVDLFPQTFHMETVLHLAR